LARKQDGKSLAAVRLARTICSKINWAYWRHSTLQVKPALQLFLSPAPAGIPETLTGDAEVVEVLLEGAWEPVLAESDLAALVRIHHSAASWLSDS
jgi:hypothetical protein